MKTTASYTSPLILAAFFLVIALLNNWPVFLGRAPLSTDAILQSPPFEQYWESPEAKVTHAQMSDTIRQFYQWRTFAGESVRTGTIPLWNPHILSGTPFLAEPQTGLFYPPNWSFAVFWPPVAWTLTIVMKPAMAGFFTALLARAIGATTPGAVAAGLIFALSGFITAWQGFPHADSALWMPLALYAIHRLRNETSFRFVALTALTLAMPVLAGHPGLTIHASLLAASYALWQLVSASGNRAKYLGSFVAAGLLAGALAAIQWLPTIEWILNHLQPSYDMPWGPLAGRRILALFSRDLGTDPNSSGFSIPVEAVYAGVATLLLAPLALFHTNKKEVAFFALIGFVSAAVAYGLEPVSTVSMSIPVYNSLKKEEALAIFDLALAVLAGLGVSTLETKRFPRTLDRRRIVIATILVGTVAVCTVAEFLVRYTTLSRTPWWRSTQSFGFLLALSVVFIFIRMYTRMRPQTWAAGICILIAVDMLSFSHGYVPFQPMWTVFPKAPLFDFLRSQTPPFRVATLDSGANWEAMYGIASAAGYDFPLKRFGEATSDLVLERNMHSVFLSAERIANATHRVVDMLNTKYFITTRWNESTRLLAAQPDRFRLVFSSDHVDVFENLRVLPRAWLVPATNVEILREEELQLARIRDGSFDPMSTVVLAEGPGASHSDSGPQSGNGVNGRVRSFSEAVNEVRLTVEATEPSVLVLSQVYHPSWTVSVDGIPAASLRANYTFAATHVNAGVHDVHFVFRPMSFRAGAALSLLSLAVIAVGLIGQKIRRR